MSASLPFECGSPASMGQLIKYFESQAQRLDRQTVDRHASSLSSDFESMIRFSGVPILPPAMTPSRREELRQIKKDAVLMEKRLKARHRHRTAASDNVKLMFPETSPRPTARQLNFDSGGPDWGDNLPERMGATNPVSTLATAETHLGNADEDFGLQTMDSVNSDFMSMEHGSVPRVFAGLELTSIKEQKISYDLDRLSKALNVQDMASTSGSDLSDALGNTQQLTLREEDLTDAHRLAQKFLHHSNNNSAAQTPSFCHESQDTVVEVSPEPGAQEGPNNTRNSPSTLEHTHTSMGSSPGCGSASTTGTTDSQRSNRSSPKSLKNAVHFASFLTEYKTSTSQLFERPMIVKKKMPHEQSIDPMVQAIASEGVTPIIGDPSEVRHRSHHKGQVDGDSSGSLLNRVALNPDSDTSPLTPPFDAGAGVPFQNYGKSEHYSSDKENDASHSHSVLAQVHRKSPERSGRSSHSPKDQKNGERWAVQRKAPERVAYSTQSPEVGTRGYTSDESSGRQYYTAAAVGAVSGVGPQSLPSRVDHVGANNQAISSTPAVEERGPVPVSGVISVGQASVSDSQGSAKSGVLTGVSESSSSTIRDSGNLAMNIVVGGRGSVGEDLGLEAGSAGIAQEDSAPQNKDNPSASNTVQAPSHSPKKLNIDCEPSQYSNTVEDPEETLETPPKSFIRRGSYTLSEPSPALLKLRARNQVGSEPQKSLAVVENQPAEPAAPVAKSSQHSHTAADTKLRVPRKLPTVSSTLKPQEINASGLSGSTEAEREGKAEHINKYLSQVHFQNSMNLSCQSWDAVEQNTKHDGVRPSPDIAAEETDPQHSNKDATQEESEDDGEHNTTDDSSMLGVLRSLAESVQGSRDQASVTQLLTLHQQQMERERQTLISQQQKDMEELFVQQRREMLQLESEIKHAQQMEKEQQDFLMQNLPENIKIKAHNHSDEFSPLNTGNFVSQNGSDGLMQLPAEPRPPPSVTTDAINSLDNRRPQSLPHRTVVVAPPAPAPPGSSVEDFSLQLQPKSFPGTVQVKPVHRAKKTSPYPLLKKSKVSPYSPRATAWAEDSQTHVKTVSGNDTPSPRSPRAGQHQVLRIPVQSPSSSSSPRIHRPLMLRSPFKSSASGYKNTKVVVPSEAYTPQMQRKFAKITAVAKGFLTRCLLRSDKVQELIKTIKDTREFAFKFQTETPVKKGVFTPQDRALLERIVAQLQAALLDIHEIFFEIPCGERMALIEQTRARELDKRVKMSRDSLRGSGPRISQATLKALERKRKAREAEASMDASISRPRTAPPATSSPRCQNHTDIRALKPLQGQGEHRSGTTAENKPDSSRSDKDRPRTAPAKQLTRPKRITALSAKQTNTPPTSQMEAGKDLSKDGKPTSSTAAHKNVNKSKSASSSKSVPSRTGKSWR